MSTEGATEAIAAAYRRTIATAQARVQAARPLHPARRYDPTNILRS
jgi:hypothetical protein